MVDKGDQGIQENGIRRVKLRKNERRGKCEGRYLRVNGEIEVRKERVWAWAWRAGARGFLRFLGTIRILR